MCNEAKGPRIFYGWLVVAACFAATFTLVERSDCHTAPFKHVADEAANEYLSSLEGTDRLVLLKGDQDILPGIECLLSPGHTVALQAVAVNTAKGTAILGSDCAHVFRNYQENWPSALIVDLVAWMKTYEKLRERASSLDLMFPGHDSLMSENYPEVAKDVTKLA